MKRTKTFITSCCLTIGLAASMPMGMYAQERSPQERMIEIGCKDNQAMKHLDILSNRFGGRLLGSDAYENAAEWCAHMFRQWGLEVWMQEAGEVPVGFNRGPWFGKMIGGNGMSLHFATPSYTVGTKGVQRGHVLKEPLTRAEFEMMKGNLNGAWVLIGGKNDGFPIDWTEKGDSIRATVIAKNEEIDRKNREIRAFNRSLKEMPEKDVKKKGLVEKELIPYDFTPALSIKRWLKPVSSASYSHQKFRSVLYMTERT